MYYENCCTTVAVISTHFVTRWLRHPGDELHIVSPVYTHFVILCTSSPGWLLTSSPPKKSLRRRRGIIKQLQRITSTPNYTCCNTSPPMLQVIYSRHQEELQVDVDAVQVDAAFRYWVRHVSSVAVQVLEVRHRIQL